MLAVVLTPQGKVDATKRYAKRFQHNAITQFN